MSIFAPADRTAQLWAIADEMTTILWETGGKPEGEQLGRLTGLCNALTLVVMMKRGEDGVAPSSGAADPILKTMTEMGEEVGRYRRALVDLIEEVDADTCRHEAVKRGGAIWTICQDCDRKWADDQGGFVPYSDPPALAAARALVETKSVG